MNSVGCEGWGTPAVVGNSQGAPFALACAEEGIPSAPAVVSGTDEVAAPQFASLLSADLRGLVERTACDPGGAGEFFAGFTADAMWGMVMAQIPACDLAVYQDPDFAAVYPDNGALLVSRVPGADRRLVPGIGGALLWTHAEPILTSLLEKAGADG